MTAQETIQYITSTAAAGDATVETKLEVMRIPVADADRSMRFYKSLGWRLDANFLFSEHERAIQFTPLGSDASIQFDIGSTSGPVTGMLVVSDIDAAREDLVARGVEVSGVFHREGDDAQVPGPAPDHFDYGSFAAFTDPDGNVWLLQEVNNRLPGRLWADRLSFGSVEELVDALRRAEEAHGGYEQQLGHRHDDWAPWYAEYMAREQAGEVVPA
jgi:catechol 2,3-dioxygenase-like lactoylglutathione lyase family enzyme